MATQTNQFQPTNFPSGIPITKQSFMNWDQAIVVFGLWTCVPSTVDDVVVVCNWAAANNYQVRASGIRHTWSWLTVTPLTESSNVILINTVPKLNQILETPAVGAQPATVKVQTGCTMDALMLALEQVSGGTGDASGFGFPHIPAPGHLTVGGVLAIDAHGSAVPSQTDSFSASYGSLSNQILAFTAIVSNPTTGVYGTQSFTRGQAGGDDTAFLTHLGRAFLVDVTLQVIPNFNLRCQSFTNISATTLFAAPTATNPIQADSFASFLNQSGRVEAIWYPFSDNPWLKVWTHNATQPQGSTLVTSPYNYPFSDNLPSFVTDLIKLMLGVPLNLAAILLDIYDWYNSIKANSSMAAVAPSQNNVAFKSQLSSIGTCLMAAYAKGGGALYTPCFGQLMAWVTEVALYFNNSDIWGPSKNTLIYIKDTTLKVSANGYAVSMKKENVQQAISEFVNIFSTLLTSFQANNQFPINAPLEIRVTSLDDPRSVAASNASSPTISALNYDTEAIQNGWDVALWLDVLSLPDTPNSNAFYEQMETQLAGNQWFNGVNGRIRPEWSKGWAYTATDGAWTNQAVMTQFKQTFAGWTTEVATLAKYDASNLFTNPFLTQFFS